MATPYFRKPTSRVEGSYDIQPGSRSVWRMRINEGQHGSIVLNGGKGLTVTSNNPAVVPNDAAVLETTNLASDAVQIRFYGLSADRDRPGTAMLEARQGSGVEPATFMQIQVQSIGGKRAFFQLDEPQMALHAPDTPVHYSMTYKETVKRSLSPSEVIDLVVKKGSLQHLVVSCHGQPSAAKGPYLELGTGFGPSDVDVFHKLYPNLQQAIWFGSCSLCGTEEGVSYCSQIAQRSGCYVIAPGIVLPPLKSGPNQIEVFTRSLPHFFDRDGKSMSQSSFLRLHKDLGFKLIRVQR